MAKGSIVVSLRSKGLPSFNKAVFLDFRYQAVQFATEFLDIFFSVLVTFSTLSWTAWIGVGVHIVSLAGTLAAGTFGNATIELMFPFFVYVLLPLLIFMAVIFMRRERALKHIADLKSIFVALLLSRPQGSTQAQRDLSDELHRKAVAYIEDLHKYLQHRRPYARHFYLPYRTNNPSPTDELLKVSRELGLLQRRVHRGVRDMHRAVAGLRGAGLPEAEASSLTGRITALHAATEQLINIKEMRTPVTLRATVRWMVVVLLPVAMAPYWNLVGEVMGRQMAFSGIVGVMTHVALMVVVDVAVGLEDPFDDTALDAISLYEMLDQLEVMTAPPVEEDGYESADGGSGSPRPASSVVDPQQVSIYLASTPGVPGGAANGGGGGDLAAANPAQPGGANANGGSGAAYQATPGAAGAGGGRGGEGTVGMPGPAGAATLGGAGGVGSPGPASPGPSGPVATQGGGGGGGARAGVRPAGGAPAVRGSVMASETTAVGPPSIDASGMGGGGGGALRSITSPPLPEVAVPVRAPIVMPPMPALAGTAIYRTAGPTVA